MKSAVAICFLIFALAIFTRGFWHSTPTIADLDAALTAQLKQQWALKKDAADQRSIKAAHLGKFYRPSGSDTDYVELEVLWKDTRQFTSSPIVPMGDQAVAVSAEVPETRQNLSAILPLRH